MSESGDKRTSSEPDSISLSDFNKKPKLDNNEPSLTTALPVLSETLMLDKVQEDTINQLVQSSSSESITTVLPANGKRTSFFLCLQFILIFFFFLPCM